MISPTLKKYYPLVVFILVITLVAIIYNYHEIILKRPQSVHNWRQSDCNSIALNYYQGGMHFFDPELHLLVSESKTSGKCRPSEIPILYYAVAILYKIFGYHETIFRIFNTLLFFLGLLFLFRTLYFLLKDIFWATTLTTLFFTSPVLVYYGNNFLSNTPALAFVIISWYYFIRYSVNKKPKFFFTSMLMLLLAASLKITALFSLCAFFGVYLLELLRLKKFDGERKLLAKNHRFLIYSITIFTIITLWVYAAYSYNQQHGCVYFSTRIFPFWNFDLEEIKVIMSSIVVVWGNQYFHQSVFIFLISCLLFLLVQFKKTNQLITYSILFTTIGSAIYFLLQFWTFRDHDYYAIGIYILPILIIINTFDLLKRHFNKLFNSFMLKISFVVFILFNVTYAQKNLDKRYQEPSSGVSKMKDIHSITPYLRSIGITSNDYVISIPDGSHTSLYLMNQKGWTEFIPIEKTQDIQSLIKKGAKYLIVNGISELYNKPYLQKFCTNLIGRYNDVLIFNLKGEKKNFHLTQRKIKKSYYCDAETIDNNKEFFINLSDSSLFLYGSTQSNEHSYNGKYSSKLHEQSPFGMTFYLNDLKLGESIDVSVWRKTDSITNSNLVISSEEYYNIAYQTEEKDSNGWEQLSAKVFISEKLNNQNLSIYLYNPDKKPVYFDDLRIIRYKSVFKD